MPHDDPVDPGPADSTPSAAVPARRTAFVVVGGDPLPPAVAHAVAQAIAADDDAVVIAADSGLDHALDAGLAPTILVGDMDSVSATALRWARHHGIAIHEHPPAKDDTDTELALATAIHVGATDVVMVGGGGDRLDHSIGALTALGHGSMSGLHSVTALWSASTVHVVHAPRSLALGLPIGTTFSLLALHGRCTGVGEVGSQWPLDDAVLEPGSSLGISNVAVDTTVTVCVATGVLTIVVPAHTALPPTTAGLSCIDPSPS